MPFKKAGCAVGEHELGKLIFPRPSENDGVAAICQARQGESEIKATKISKNLRGNIYTPGICVH